MKTFLYCLCTLRDGAKDNVSVPGGRIYYHDYLLLVIDAVDVEHAVRALHAKIFGSFVRSSPSLSSPLVTIYYTSDYYGVGNKRPDNFPEGYFYFYLKEAEASDTITHPNLAERMHYKIVAPDHLIDKK